MSKFRFYITALSSRVEVFPLNFMRTSLVDAKDDGKVFYRRKFNGTLRFVDNNGGDDFSMLYVIEVSSPCERIILEIEERDSGLDTYHNYWTGHFSTTDGTFDLDRCTFTITPKPFDDYFDIDLYGDEQKNILAAGLTHVTTNTPTIAYTRNYFIVDVIEYLIQEIAPAATLTSSFLNNSSNPILGGTNKYRYLTIAQKSDIKRPTSSNPATVGMMSFNELMEILKMYNLYWTFDGSVLRIEHYDYWEGGDGLDLRIQSISQGSNKYSYLKDDMPKYEKFAFLEAGNDNYVEHVISYKTPCVNNDVTDEFAVNVTTDIEYIETCMADTDLVSNISDDGWVILASYYDGADYQVYYGVTPAYPSATYNYVNSWAYLLRAFFMHGRAQISGYINGDAIDFISVRKIKKQDINAIVCHSDAYDPNDYLTTELGETWFSGQKGYVQQATLHPDGKVEFALLYGEDRNETPSVIPKYKVLHCVVDLPRHVYSYLSEPNTVDTYYVVLFDEGEITEECLEILIPAGTTYQDDLADVEHTTVDGIYTEHSSLSGWLFVYNDNETWTEIADCGSPPAPPAGPPADPVLLGAVQYDQWGCVEVGWTEPATSTYYEVYRKIDAGAYELIATVTAAQNPYDDCESQDHGYRPATFCYQVKACNETGCSGSSNEICVDVNTA